MAVAREHASRHPATVIAQQPESVKHQRQQHEIRLAEIEHVEHEGDGNEARSASSQGLGFRPDPAIACDNCAVIHHATMLRNDRHR